jgi:phosphatidylserine/phosphatidylglycerophosphate/cardiolipin synthase-like enzyme
MFDWNDLGRFKAAGRLPDQYPANARNFFSPEDRVHELLTALLNYARSSLVLNMYGYDDDALNAIILTHAANPKVYVQMSLDRSQAGGVHERKLLAGVLGQPACNVAIGVSTKHAISHLKVCIIDGLYTVSGSTNWSLSGETAQDNQLTLSNDPVIAAEYRAILDRNHTAMLSQASAISNVAMLSQASAPSPAEPATGQRLPNLEHLYGQPSENKTTL